MPGTSSPSGAPPAVTAASYPDSSGSDASHQRGDGGAVSSYPDAAPYDDEEDYVVSYDPSRHAPPGGAPAFLYATNPMLAGAGATAPPRPGWPSATSTSSSRAGGVGWVNPQYAHIMGFDPTLTTYEPALEYAYGGRINSLATAPPPTGGRGGVNTRFDFHYSYADDTAGASRSGGATPAMEEYEDEPQPVQPASPVGARSFYGVFATTPRGAAAAHAAAIATAPARAPGPSWAGGSWPPRIAGSDRRLGSAARRGTGAGRADGGGTGLQAVAVPLQAMPLPAAQSAVPVPLLRNVPASSQRRRQEL